MLGEFGAPFGPRANGGLLKALNPEILEPGAGIEPATFRLQGGRSTN